MRDANQVAPGDSVKGMARRANFLVDLVAASNAGKEGEHDEKVSSVSRNIDTSLYTPRMIKSIEPTYMVPWIIRRMETVFGWRVCADCSNEGERAVEVSVPGDGSNCEDGDRREGGRRRKRRRFLRCPRLAISGSPKKERGKRGLTLGADDDDDANLLWNTTGKFS